MHFKAVLGFKIQSIRGKAELDNRDFKIDLPLVETICKVFAITEIFCISSLTHFSCKLEQRLSETSLIWEQLLIVYTRTS